MDGIKFLGEYTNCPVSQILLTGYILLYWDFRVCDLNNMLLIPLT